MKKVKNILLLLTAIFTLGCSQTIIFEDIQTPTPTPTPKPEPEPDLDTSSYVDLSSEGTANCYLVKAAGKYKFKTVKGNSNIAVDSVAIATVLWESFGTSTKPNEGDLIASATYKDGYVYFATPTTFKNGNASIAVRDSNAKILWSWHIWLSKEGWKDDVYPKNAGTMMDRNLGATSATPGSVGSLGLLYQWGRKDPFLGSRSISSIALAVSTGSWNSVSTQQTVDYVTANPMTFVCGYSEWCTGDGAEDSNYAKRWTESTKSMYDPCPVGYRVPKGGENGFWATALGTSNSTSAGTTWDSTNNGRHWTLADRTTAAWYPAVGCRDDNGGALSKVGSYGYCWSASPNPSNSFNAYYLRFDSGNVYPASSSSRGDGYSVRCVSTTATSNPEPEPEPEPTPGITSAPYAVGDYYNDGTKEGVVFEVSADGTSGKIVSMMQSTGTLQWSSDETEQKRLIGADSETDGAYNTAKVKAISGWETKYPAFKWCADLGDDWYLPAKEELRTICKNKDKLNTNLTDMLSSNNHWSSTEYDKQYSTGEFCAWVVNLNYGSTYSINKYLDRYVRAVATFGDAQQSDPTPEPTEPANNEIWYTSTDGAVIAHNSGSVSGANIVSNTYTNGKGVLTFDGNVTKILSNPFSAKSKLKSIVLPNSVTHIYPQAFGICYNLVDVDLGSGLTYIGNAAFDACSALTSITIPDSVTFIGPAPFLACYNLANFYGAAATDDHKGLVIDNTFVAFAPAGPTEYSIPHGVTVIQDGSFNDCQKITKVTIPATVVEIEEQAFYRCYALSVVNCLPTTPPTLLMHSSYGTFDSNASDRKIYVPASSVSAYKSASGWSTYADAIVADPSSFTSAPYAVGDYYNDGTKEGVVFDVSADGTSGKIVSMMQSTDTLQWSSDETEQKRLIGADSETDGAANMAVIKAISGWETKYPAFKWCADLGDGWYLPAKEELLTIYNNKDKLNTNLTNKLSTDYYWSSTEYDYQYSDGRFCVWRVDMSDGYTNRSSDKSDYRYVRAAATFGDTPKPEPEPDFDNSSYIDLSAEGTANCYLVKAAGKYKFKAVKGNSAQSVGAASSATVLWESFGTSNTPNVGDLIASATYKDGYVYFATPTTFKSGNASIAVRDLSGTILWSWHIWCSAEGWKDDIYPNNAGTMMDRNLGATSATPGSVGALGLMYQWGRKDPFLGSSSVSSSTLAVSTGTWSSVTTQQTVDYVTANPMIFVCGYSEWCTGDGAKGSNYAKRWTESEKSMYDPCPVGYRVPDGGKNGFWATALGTSNSTSAGTTWDSTNKGRHWTLSDGTTAWYPAVGCRSDDSGSLYDVGEGGCCWSASPNPSSTTYAYRLSFYYNGNVVPASNYYRGYGCSVRCVRE